MTIPTQKSALPGPVPPSSESTRPDATGPDLPPRGATWTAPLGAAAVVTALATGLSYLLPTDLKALGVASVFLAGAYVLVVRHDDTALIRRFGLSLGGLVEPEPLDFRRLAREGGVALAWAAALAALAFPPFWAGYVAWYHPSSPFLPQLPPGFVESALGQILVIALPEEAFYRGYLQTALDDGLGRRVRVLGAEVGPGLLLASAIFAVGHVATFVHPHRLAVFFPALLFGWLRARTGGIGAPLAFHALCNLFADTLAQSYGLAP